MPDLKKFFKKTSVSQTEEQAPEGTQRSLG